MTTSCLSKYTMKFSVLTACKFSNSHVKQGHIDSNYPTKMLRKILSQIFMKMKMSHATLTGGDVDSINVLNKNYLFPLVACYSLLTR